MVHLEDFLGELLQLLGVPYLWNGKSRAGIDCSGVVTYALRHAGGPDWRNTHNSERLWDSLPPVHELLPGVLVFYRGKEGRIAHVMVHVAGGLVIGACDGGSMTTTPEIAQRQGARVKVRRRFDYRKDVAGFRSLNLASREDLHG